MSKPIFRLSIKTKEVNTSFLIAGDILHIIENIKILFSDIEELTISEPLNNKSLQNDNSTTKPIKIQITPIDKI